MKTIKKANVTSNALRVPSQAADQLNTDMYLFIRKDLNTLKQVVVCAVQFKDSKGRVTQTEDIIIKGLDLARFETYDARLKVVVPAIEIIEGKKVETPTTCVKDIKKYLRKELIKLPVRMVYDKGYGWSNDEVTRNVRFDGSTIVGIGSVILDDHEHHLKKIGDKVKTIEICNEVMKDRISTQFLLATSLAAPIFGALDLKSLIANVSGRSSQGKSIILRLCMSLWSKPEDENLATTWYNTENAICARLNNLEGVPFLLDDTSQGSNSNFTSVVYNIEEGRSKGRLNKLFIVDNVATWHTCIFSASETSMYDKTDEEKKGILRRLVEIDVVQGDLIKDEKQARKVAAVCKENYGAIGMEFVEKLFEKGLTDNDFEKLRNVLEEEQNCLQSIVKSNGVSRGLAEKLAVVLLAAKLGKEYLGFNFDIDDLTEYAQTLIVKSDIKIKKAVIDKKDFDTCYEEVCKYAEEKFDERFKSEFVYHVPVEYFNVIEKKLGYNFRELRALFMKHGICTFNTPSDEKGLDNSVKIAPLEGGAKVTKKVITVTKMI